MGDSCTYVINGYIKNGNKYTVYSYFIEQASENNAADAVEGKDYIVYNGKKCLIEHFLKNIVETDGTGCYFIFKKNA